MYHGRGVPECDGSLSALAYVIGLGKDRRVSRPSPPHDAGMAKEAGMSHRPVRIGSWCSVLLVILFVWSAPVTALPTTTTTGTPASTTTTSVATTSTTVVAAAVPTVSVAPSTGLSDLETVTVAGTGLVADAPFNVAQCNIFNGKAGGVCYEPTRKSVRTDSSGAFTTSFVLRRIIVETGASVDCASGPARCGIIVGEVSQVVVAPLAFDASVPANGPVVTAIPANGLHDGDTISVAGTGFTPDEKVVIAQCASTSLGLSSCDPSNETTVLADGKGSFPATAFVVRESITIVGVPGGPLGCRPTASEAVPCVVVAANFVGGSEFAAAAVAFAPPTELPRTGGASFPLGVVALTTVVAGAAVVTTARRGRGRGRG